jgi:hypothetical protein
VTQTLDAAGEIAGVVDVTDAGKAHPSLQFRLANRRPLVDVLQALADFFVVVSVFCQACLAAVVYLFAPITGQLHRIVKLLAVLALAVDRRCCQASFILESCWVNREMTLRIGDVHKQTRL